MSTGYKIDNQAGTYYLTLQVIDWVDIFSRKIYRDILIDSMDFCRKEKGLRILAYTIMTNHMHCILNARDENLSDILRDLKRFTSTKILKTIETIEESRKDWMLKRFEFAARSNIRSGKHQFWTHENHAEEIYSNKFIIQKMNYIHFNPVRAGWVEKPEDWLYSSARNYSGLNSLMDIDFFDSVL